MVNQNTIVKIVAVFLYVNTVDKKELAESAVGMLYASTVGEKTNVYLVAEFLSVNMKSKEVIVNFVPTL